MRIFLIASLILMLSGCTTIEVAEEITKATQSIKTSVDNMINTNPDTNDAVDNGDLSSTNTDSFVKDVEIVEREKKDVRKKIEVQKKIVEVVFLRKTHAEIKTWLGTPQLKRIDGDIQMLRFDTNNCRLFLFFNTETNLIIVRHFEFRDNYGNLINVKKKIQECYKNLNLN